MRGGGVGREISIITPLLSRWLKNVLIYSAPKNISTPVFTVGRFRPFFPPPCPTRRVPPRLVRDRLHKKKKGLHNETKITDMTYGLVPFILTRLLLHPHAVPFAFRRVRVRVRVFNARRPFPLHERSGRAADEHRQAAAGAFVP